jgi:hypothetical protein
MLFFFFFSLLMFGYLANFASVSYATKWTPTNRLIGFSETDQITGGLLFFRMKRRRRKAVRDLAHQAVKTQRKVCVNSTHSTGHYAIRRPALHYTIRAQQPPILAEQRTQIM